MTSLENHYANLNRVTFGQWAIRAIMMNSSVSLQIFATPFLEGEYAREKVCESSSIAFY